METRASLRGVRLSAQKRPPGCGSGARQAGWSGSQHPGLQPEKGAGIVKRCWSRLSPTPSTTTALISTN